MYMNELILQINVVMMTLSAPFIGVHATLLSSNTLFTPIEDAVDDGAASSRDSRTFLTPSDVRKTRVKRDPCTLIDNENN